MTWSRRLLVTMSVVTFGTFVMACDALTRAEAQDALEQIEVSSQASALTGASVEITTNFTIGAAAAAAAEEVQTFVESQLPCAAFTLDGGTLTIEYGANPGNCEYNGHTFSGTHAFSIMANEMSGVDVRHTWTDFSNGVIEIDGTATVTWSGGNGEGISRRIQHDYTWTRLSDGLMGSGTGDRTQSSTDLTVGFMVNGNQSWTGSAGTWNLAITGVDMRWIDAVPQAGSYTLTTPSNKMLSLAFDRVDFNTINVEITNGNKSFDFDVTNTNITE